jgi:hypothetical protein
MSQLSIDPDLSLRLNFNAEDLAANRAGRMTEKQVKLLEIKRIPLMQRAWIVGFLSSLAIIAWLLQLSAAIASSSRTAPVLLFAFLLGLAGMGLSAFILYRTITAINEDIAVKQVQKVSGQPKSSQTPRLIIGDLPLAVTPEVFIHFKPHEYYTVYYAPNSKIVLSAEPYQP